jgi:hypothetical protein
LWWVSKVMFRLHHDIHENLNFGFSWVILVFRHFEEILPYNNNKKECIKKWQFRNRNEHLQAQYCFIFSNLTGRLNFPNEIG